MARIEPTRLLLCASLGYGRFAESLSLPIPTDDGYGHNTGFTALTSGPGGQIERASLTDITGDGLNVIKLSKSHLLLIPQRD